VLTPYQAYRLWQCYNLTEDYVLEHTERLVAIKISNIPKFYARFLINGVDDWSLLKDAYEWDQMLVSFEFALLGEILMLGKFKGCKIILKIAYKKSLISLTKSYWGYRCFKMLQLGY